MKIECLGDGQWVEEKVASQPCLLGRDVFERWKRGDVTATAFLDKSRFPVIFSTVAFDPHMIIFSVEDQTNRSRRRGHVASTSAIPFPHLRGNIFIGVRKRNTSTLIPSWLRLLWLNSWEMMCQRGKGGR